MRKCFSYQNFQICEKKFFLNLDGSEQSMGFLNVNMLNHHSFYGQVNNDLKKYMKADCFKTSKICRMETDGLKIAEPSIFNMFMAVV